MQEVRSSIQTPLRGICIPEHSWFSPARSRRKRALQTTAALRSVASARPEPAGLPRRFATWLPFGSPRSSRLAEAGLPDYRRPPVGGFGNTCQPFLNPQRRMRCSFKRLAHCRFQHRVPRRFATWLRWLNRQCETQTSHKEAMSGEPATGQENTNQAYG